MNLLSSAGQAVRGKRVRWNQACRLTTLGMPVREFIDSSGVKWRVWSTRPSRGEMLSGEFEHGWLTFESPTSLKRCTPIPEGWETASAERLERLCVGAAETRRTPSAGRRAVDDEETTSGRDGRGLDR